MNGNTSIVPQTSPTSTNAEAASTDTDETASPPWAVAEPTKTTGTESTDANMTATSTGPAGVSTDTSVTPSSPKAIIMSEDGALNVIVPLTTVAESTDMTFTTFTL